MLQLQAVGLLQIFGVVSVYLLTIQVIIGQGGINLSDGNVAVSTSDLLYRVAELIPDSNSMDGNASPYDSWPSVSDFRTAYKKCFNADTHKHNSTTKFQGRSYLLPSTHEVLRRHRAEHRFSGFFRTRDLDITFERGLSVRAEVG